MRSTGIVRRLDELGRIVLPKEIRKILGLEIKDPMEIYIDENKIILKKYEPDCIFCGGTKGVKIFKNKNVCQSCKEEMEAEED